MLLRRDFFESFHHRRTARPGDPLEVMTAVSAASREDVDDLCDRALSTGATPASAPDDQGFMYGRSFVDLDGHVWEVMWMDPQAAGLPSPRPPQARCPSPSSFSSSATSAIEVRSTIRSTSSKPSAAVVGVGHVAAPDRVEVPEQEHDATTLASYVGQVVVVHHQQQVRPNQAASNCLGAVRARVVALGEQRSRRRGCPSARPTCQLPVPELVTSTAEASPARSTSSVSTTSAIGERQMLPRQTKRDPVRRAGRRGQRGWQRHRRLGAGEDDAQHHRDDRDDDRAEHRGAEPVDVEAEVEAAPRSRW